MLIPLARWKRNNDAIVEKVGSGFPASSAQRNPRKLKHTDFVIT